MSLVVFTAYVALSHRLSLLQARDELVDYVCKKEMGVYSQIFAPVGDTAQLDRVGIALLPRLNLVFVRDMTAALV